MNTTRTRKSSPAASNPAIATKPPRSRAKVSAAASESAPAVLTGLAPETAPAAAAVKTARRAPKSAGVAASSKTRARAGGKTSPPSAAAELKPKAKSTARKTSKPELAAQPVVVLPPPGKAPRKTGKAKSTVQTVDVQVRDAVIARLDAMKANDLKVIDVRGKTSITDCLVIASGTSTRHVRSMGDEVIVTAKKFGLPPIGVEGEKDAEWMLVDLGDTVVHVMLPRARDFYGLERLWTLAEESRAASALSLTSA